MSSTYTQLPPEVRRDLLVERIGAVERDRYGIELDAEISGSEQAKTRLAEIDARLEKAREMLAAIDDEIKRAKK